MGIIIIIVGIYFFYLIFSESKSSSSSSSNYKYGNYSSGSNYSPPKTYNRTESKPTTITPKKISVTPSTIRSQPDLKLSLVDGQYRVFQNYIINGTQYTYGFPKDNCYDKRVWIGIGSEELERISYQEAVYRLKNQPVPLLAEKPTNNNLYYEDHDDDLPF